MEADLVNGGKPYPFVAIGNGLIAITHRRIQHLNKVTTALLLPRRETGIHHFKLMMIDSSALISIFTPKAFERRAW